MYSIEIQIISQQNDIPESDFLLNIASKALEITRTPNCTATIRIVDEQEGANLNQIYRHKDGATNVLSFSYDNSLEFLASESNYLGDLVLCAPILTGEAAEQNIELNAHYAHLIVHGLLHLQGYDHQEECQAKVMETKEIDILKQLGFANPYD